MIERLLSSAAAVVGVVVVLAGIGVFQGGYPWPASFAAVPEWVAPATWAGLVWAWENTEQANWLLVTIAVVVMLAPVLLGVVSRSGRRDPNRMFSSDERKVGFARAENRCEMDNWLMMRCHRRAEHGDHWYPWSKGGATSMANFVAGCAKHNLAKSNTWPTLWQTARVAARRRRYFPRGYTARPGERF